MRKFVFAAVAAASVLSAVAPASAQYWRDRDYRWGGRDRVIVQENPGIQNSTLITLFALQALQAAQQQKEEPVVVERRSTTREYVPLK